ncbi:MAG: hypothetical protein NT026_00985 [Candidatus Staskawiczbacteria bacterium]|nr:hypothetical protein [Candidatus Staskawiczbacteria bacterium]
MNKIFKIVMVILIIIIVIAAVIFVYFFTGKAPEQKSITWGVDFSQMQSEALKLDWKKNYLAVLDDLGVKNLKLHTQWDFIEGKKGNYFFTDIDWQIKEAEKRNAKVIYVLGMKTGRWPECHIPSWVDSLSQEQQQTELLKYMSAVVLRYKDSKVISAWQVENEPLFKFGQCPAWYYESDDFLKTEVALVKAIDPGRPVIVTDSGEQSLWSKVAQIGDIVGVTMYRKVWARLNDSAGFYVNSFLPSINYYKKAQLIKQLFNKKVICIELQAEPWTPNLFYDEPLQEQLKTMNLDQFKKNVEYAQKTGLDTFYLWGAEWWYWMKEKQGQPDIWNEAKKLFSN